METHRGAAEDTTAPLASMLVDDRVVQ